MRAGLQELVDLVREIGQLSTDEVPAEPQAIFDAKTIRKVELLAQYGLSQEEPTMGVNDIPLDTLDCQRCGACCVHGGEITVMNGIDRAVPRHLTRSVRRMMGYFSDDHFDMRRMARVQLTDVDDQHSRCVAFSGEIGQPCGCKIYQCRPKVCQEFQPGSEDCLQARREARLA